LKASTLAIAAIPIVGLGIYAIIRAASGAKTYALILTHSGPGTIDMTDGTHSYPGPTQVTINTVPASGYQANWNVNGVDVAENVNSYSVYLTGIVSVIVSFVLQGGGGPGPIAGIKPIGTVGLLQNFRFWYGTPFSAIDIAECDENWNDGRCQSQLMTFKVFDAANNGVPNIDVAIYPQANPDATAYKGLLMLSGYTNINPSNPLHITTDAQGLATFPIFNLYGADDISVDGGGIELSRGTNLYIDKSTFPGPFPSTARIMPVYHGLAAGIGWLFSGNGGGGTITYGKIIEADIVGTDKYAIQQIMVNYGVKWKA
jgi:hypothetical protein